MLSGRCNERPQALSDKDSDMNDKAPTPPENPLTAFYHDRYPEQTQPYPGLQQKMQPLPDCGEKSYRGTGRLKGRRALVTGGDSGIGRAVAIAFAREGADVAIACMPQERPDALAVCELIEAENRKTRLIEGDLGDERYCASMVEQAADALGGLDTLALVAGHQVATRGIDAVTTEQLERVFAINVFSLFWTFKAALPLLPAGASIITTASRQAFSPEPTLPDYAASKGAIKVFSQAMAKQLAPKGIRVNIVAPGPIWTPLQISGGRLPEEIPDFGRETPFKRAGQPVELAGLYVFLASQESDYISGEVFGVTGGEPIR